MVADECVERSMLDDWCLLLSARMSRSTPANKLRTARLDQQRGFRRSL